MIHEKEFVKKNCAFLFSVFRLYFPIFFVRGPFRAFF